MRALDRHSEIVALATALEISPSELMKVPVPAWGYGHTGSVQHALMAASDDLPGGRVSPVDALRSRVAALISAQEPVASAWAELAAAIR